MVRRDAFVAIRAGRKRDVLIYVRRGAYATVSRFDPTDRVIFGKNGASRYLTVSHDLERHLVGRGVAAERVPPALQMAVKQMKLFYFERFTVAQLAKLCGTNPSHFAHAFKKAFGTSPIDWLRRERINQAKRRLVGTSDRIEEIATQVGYSDRFFFSKDFKKFTGHTPREFRALEGN